MSRTLSELSERRASESEHPLEAIGFTRVPESEVTTKMRELTPYLAMKVLGQEEVIIACDEDHQLYSRSGPGKELPPTFDFV